jgi:hypothetical protein
MKNTTQHIGMLKIIERLPSSANGNPRYLLQIDGWTCRTGVDSMLGYSVANYDGKMVKARIGTYYGKATVHSLEGANNE